ncbi:AN1-type zinc finger domain-containing protein [Halorussus rarus]|uniref:AN1-type zinc finger domain-containing protein n=1 Tax=Halorussus TaxID=1070314 RepID=UPI000E216DF5|nr:hypothetical protein [Halorussus sp. JP-T4]
MGTCKRCGEKMTGDRGCSYCGNTYCPEHRLPEKHDCAGVKHWDVEGERFDSGFGGSE